MVGQQMNAPAEVIQFDLPKRPKIELKQAPPDRRTVAVVPIRAVFDKQLTHGGLQALAALCAYCNKAGVTWVSQLRLASELGISQQALAKQYRQLRELGYLEVMRRGYKGQRTDTLRVIFDPSITGEDAITMTNGPKEDTRPPAIRAEQEKAARQAEEQPDADGQRRIAQLVRDALAGSRVNKPKEYIMPKQDTRLVREMKAQIKKPAVKKTVDKVGTSSKESNNLGVVSASSYTTLEMQYNNLEVVHNTKNIDTYRQLSTTELNKLKENGMTDSEIGQAQETLEELFKAEGLTPSARVMAESILQLHLDAKT
jgi:biotin operon repressor